MPDVEEHRPLKPADAKKIVLHVLGHGSVTFSHHAIEEMGDDDLQSPDCLSVLRGGVYEPPELDGGTWRYRVSTRRICVVITIPANDRVRVITAWRNE